MGSERALARDLLHELSWGGIFGLARIRYMKHLEETIAALEARLKQAKAQKQRQDARMRTAMRRQERANERQRSLLVGIAFLARVERGEASTAQLIEMMDAALTRADERALFGLKPRPTVLAPLPIDPAG